ncbi:hypothetical protein M758_4G151700 [Ceratodon purpureus]|uniref:Uncharacterized protein n=1 Tax=Ceratodon purpureus TaxID=3225 RepID=A0A8T0ICA4_CERPU|nr:hypothetical protein KC19_4G148600 [Ceratodon purpureus]KAG0580132.1 hypothetical protein KC19_4G149500 [Ceratodon purpureus]KAG0580135.1 hypothetical protein KC19_4G149800 [Ceratodon purpureus]KAG0580138.1 hypothetical protein KC19_4G150100 [Ceratodon purpureus]KAG0580141.1 hypothetical protein KC19_4G150400 [Ceratodon purpureus]
MGGNARIRLATSSLQQLDGLPKGVSLGSTARSCLETAMFTWFLHHVQKGGGTLLRKIREYCSNTKLLVADYSTSSLDSAKVCRSSRHGKGAWSPQRN